MSDSRTLSAHGSSVQQDWRTWLPEEKTVVYAHHQKKLESVYNMFSVSLNEAIELRREGYTAQSLKALAMAVDLCQLLALPLAGLLRALHDHSKHYGTIPSTVPLDPANFVGLRVQRSARLSGLLNHVLLSQRLQFLHKVTTVLEIIENLHKDFRASVDQLVEFASLKEQVWEQLVRGHYDLNTCLRETFVLLKSFLVVLPTGELEAFQSMVQGHCQSPKDRSFLSGAINHRRMAAFAGR